MSGRSWSWAVPELRARARASSGFTLLEVSVACAVVAIAALSVFSCLSAGYDMDRQATDCVGATNLARRVMEELWTSPFDTLIPAYDNTQIVQDNLRATIRVQRVAPGTASLVRLQVSARPAEASDDLVRLVALRSDPRSPSSAWTVGN